MTISGILTLINICLLWWLFFSASNMAKKILMLILALLSSWLGLEHFRVLPTRLGNKVILHSYQKIQDSTLKALPIMV